MISSLLRICILALFYRLHDTWSVILSIIIIYVEKTSSLSTVVRPTLTHMKQQKHLWHPTSSGHMSLLLIYAIRPWPYMQIPAWSQWIAIYLQILLKYFQKHKAYAASFKNTRPTLMVFLVLATKHWSIVGLARQSWYTNYCWCSTTLTDSCVDLLAAAISYQPPPLSW